MPKKESRIHTIKKKIDVLQPAFKANLDKILDEVAGSLEALYEIATRDEKTGLYNHRFFKTVFEMELERAKRGQKFSLIAIDIDFFKKLNDTYGHLAGDEALLQLGKVLQKLLRKYDTLARFGGEEFFILLPNTPIARAHKVAERIRKNIHQNAFLKKHNVTLSLGVTEYRDRDSLTTMIKRADKALYTSKREGRNRTTRI